MLTIRAYAKVNLYLEVVGKRADGYHEIQTLYQNIDIYDTLRFSHREKGFTLRSNVPLPEDNSIKMGYEYMKTYFGIEGLGVEVTKGIPLSSGLGGESSDYAATIRAINELFSLSLSLDALDTKQMGSDVLFFLSGGGSAIGRGRGDILEFISLPIEDYKCLVVKPFIDISTKAAYERIIPGEFGKIRELVKAYEDIDIEGIKTNSFNNFEKTVREIYPPLDLVKRDVAEAGTSVQMMTGSGSAVFGISTGNIFPERLKRRYEFIHTGGFIDRAYEFL
ncbi:MAG: 4-(cytidine 5'-diphospho)-2-C-methyl-D-erythritol kinase [Thermotogae bacterium]|nr:4-(cytidine 5'-diphospho)-2-C-methyl-D-erythritol kinase [Thermotogota bacterium]